MEPPKSSQPLAVACLAPLPVANRTAYLAGAAGLITAMRRAVDTANATIVSEIADHLIDLCQRTGVTYTLNALLELRALSPERFATDAMLKVARIQSAHQELMVAIKQLGDSGPPCSPAVDPSILNQLRTSLTVPIVDNLIDVFLADAPAKVRDLRKALGAADGDGIKRAAHDLKSTSAAIGALRLSELAMRLESLGGTSSIAAAAPIVDAAERELNQVAMELKGIVQKATVS
jgi:HPt (histidine-containing phosphotransfer) domain-containing protein